MRESIAIPCMLFVLAIFALAIPTPAAAEERTPPESVEPPIEPTAPLSIHVDFIQAGRTQFLLHEPIIVEVSLLNQLHKPIDNLVSLEGGWANKWVLDFEFTSESGRKCGYHPGASNWDRVREMGEVVRLQPHSRMYGEFEITAHSNLDVPGKYTVRALYRLAFATIDGVSWPEVLGVDLQDKKEIVAKERLVSTAIPFEIILPTRNDFDALLLLGNGVAEWDWAGRGSVARGAGGHALDVENYTSAVEKFPNSVYTAYAAFYVGSYWYHLRDWSSARKFLQHAASKKEYALADDAMLMLARCSRAENDPDTARKILENLLWQYPRGAQAAAARRELESLRSEEKQASPPGGAATVSPDGAVAGVPSSSAGPTAQPAPNETETQQDTSRGNGPPKEPAPAPKKTLRGDPNQMAIPSASNAFSLFTLITSAVSLLAGYLLGRYRRKFRRTG